VIDPGASLDIAGDLRGDNFGMIEGRDQVAMTREVRGEVGGGATVAAAVVRVEDERPRAGLVGAPDIAGGETVASRVAGVEGVGADGDLVPRNSGYGHGVKRTGGEVSKSMSDDGWIIVRYASL
jgi:hypothetical protein